MDQINYHVSIQLDELIHISRDESMKPLKKSVIKMINDHVKKLEDVRDNMFMRLFYSIHLSQHILM